MTDNNRSLLLQVKDGMPIYDAAGEQIGTAKTVYFGDEDPSQPGPETATVSSMDTHTPSIISEVGRVLTDPDTLPAELRARMVRFGYIVVDTPLFRKARYAIGDQIAGVTEDGVKLSVDEAHVFTS